MVVRGVRDLTGKQIPFAPFGCDGLNLFSAAAGADIGPNVLRRGENIRSSRSVLEQRMGDAKIVKLTDPAAAAGALTFGAVGKYATIANAAQLRLAKGSWGLRGTYNAKRNGANTSFMLSSRPNGQTWHVLGVSLAGATGIASIQWRDTASASHTLALPAVADDTRQDLLALYDAYAGTFRTWVNGTLATSVTGLSSTLQLAQSPADWHFCVEYENGVGVVANSQFLGAMDAWTLFTFPGMAPSLEDADSNPTLRDMLIAHSSREWPAPEWDAVVFNYDFDGGVGASVIDSSKHKNHAIITGVPTSGAGVANSSVVGNYIGRQEQPNGAETNLVVAAGSLYYEPLNAGV